MPDQRKKVAAQVNERKCQVIVFTIPGWLQSRWVFGTPFTLDMNQR
jgi:hypothetical protein